MPKGPPPVAARASYRPLHGYGIYPARVLHDNQDGTLDIEVEVSFGETLRLRSIKIASAESCGRGECFR